MNWLSLSRGILLVLLFASPLAFGAVEPWAWTALSVAVSVACLCWGISCVQQRSMAIVWTPLYVPGLAFLLLGLGQLFLKRTIDPIATRDSLLMLITDLIIFFLAVNLFAAASHGLGARNHACADAPLESGPNCQTGTRHRHSRTRLRNERWSQFGWLLSIYLLSMSVFALAQFFSDPTRIYWTVGTTGYNFGTYISRNNYAGLMEMLIPLAVAFFLWQNSKAHGRFFAGFAVLVAIISVVISGSRGGVTALLVEVVVASIIWRSRLSGRQTVALISLAIAVVAFALWWLPQDVLDRFQGSADSHDVSYHDRQVMTSDSLRIAQEHLTTGVGLGGFETVYPKYQTLATDYIIDYAHNDYAQALAETGVAGAILICLAIALFFVGVARLQLPSDSLETYIRLGAVIGCCGLLVHSWVDFNLHIPANSAWFAFITALTQA